MSILDAIKSIDYGDVAARAAWTFAQTFIGVLLAAGTPIIDVVFGILGAGNANWNDLIVLLFSVGSAGFAAGSSAVKTILLETYREIRRRAEMG